MKFWIRNLKLVFDQGRAILCDTCPCEFTLRRLKLYIEDGNLGIPDFYEIDLTLGIENEFDFTIFYLDQEFSGKFRMLANGPEKLCDNDIQELTFDFSFEINEPLGEDEMVLNAFVPEDNVNCVEPSIITRVPYEGTTERFTALVSACQCACLEDPAFEGALTIQTSTPVPPEEVSFIEVQEPVDPVDPSTTTVRFWVEYCYSLCELDDE